MRVNGTNISDFDINLFRVAYDIGCFVKDVDGIELLETFKKQALYRKSRQLRYSSFVYHKLCLFVPSDILEFFEKGLKLFCFNIVPSSMRYIEYPDELEEYAVAYSSLRELFSLSETHLGENSNKNIVFLPNSVRINNIRMKCLRNIYLRKNGEIFEYLYAKGVIKRFFSKDEGLRDRSVNELLTFGRVDGFIEFHYGKKDSLKIHTFTQKAHELWGSI
jgi:hypothetical protein